MITAIDAPPSFAHETQAAGIVATSLERFVLAFLLLLFCHVLVVEIALLQIPNRRPAVMNQVRLVLGMQTFDQLRRFATDVVIIGR